jgi:hypothetical protein
MAKMKCVRYKVGPSGKRRCGEFQGVAPTTQPESVNLPEAPKANPEVKPEPAPTTTGVE